MRSTDDILVENYLTGMMTPAEKAAFVERMKSDESIRRLVEADAIITTGMRKEMGTMATGAMEPGAELMARLAATTPAIGTAVTGSGGAIAAALFSGSTVKILVGAIGVAGIAIGTFLVAPLMRHDEPAAVAPPHAMETIPAEKQALPAGTERTGIGQPRPAAGPSESLRAPRPARPSEGAAAEPHPPAGAAHSTSPTASGPEKSAVVPAEGRDLLEEQLSNDPAVFSSDTVRMKVKIRQREK